MVKALYSTDKKYEDYWQGQKVRAKKNTNRAIYPIFDRAWARVSGDVLDVLNNRRYLKETNEAKRLKMIKRDPKIKQVENVLRNAGQQSLNAIFDGQAPHYYEEVPHVARYIFPWMKDVKVSKLSDAELSAMRNKPFQGATFREWIAVNTNNALKRWQGAFRAIMSDTGNVSRETLLLSELKKILASQENQNKTVMENSQIEVSRKVQTDFEVALWA